MLEKNENTYFAEFHQLFKDYKRKDSENFSFITNNKRTLTMKTTILYAKVQFRTILL